MTRYRLIALDMDGTLLGDDHKLAPRTVQAIRRACDAGVRFMVATGRDMNGVLQELDGTGLVCDYIVGSGAEVRDPRQNIISRVQMDTGVCGEIYDVLRQYPVSTIFMTGECDYSIGTPETLEEDMRQNLSVFYSNLTMEEILETEMYRHMKESTRIIPDFQALKDGKIDAAFVVAGAPTTAIVDLATSKPVYLVSLDESHTSDLLKASPYYSAYTIKAGTY